MQERLPPGPRLPGPLLGLLMFGFPGFIAWCQRRYGDRITLRLGGFGTYVYLCDPADIRQVFHADDTELHAGEANAPFLGRVLGPSSVLVTDEETHLRQRRRLSGPFHGESVARLAPLMAAIAAEDVAGWPVGEEFAVLPHMRKVTLEVILRTVIGVKDQSRLPELRDALSKLVDLSGINLLQFPFPALSDKWPWKRFGAVEARADALLREEIGRCRSDADLESRPDVLAMLVRNAEEEMTTDEIRDQLATLLLAGHETTATGLAWTLERLVRNPIVLAKAARAAREDDHAYIDAVVTETLRVRPVVPDVTRLLKRDLDLGDHLIPSGTYVDPAIAVVQRDARHYPQPGRFDPERFVGKRPDPQVWLPFGGGNRRCLGAAFAAMEMRVVLCEVLKRVELAPVGTRSERVLVRHVTLAPKRGGRVTVLRRYPSSEVRREAELSTAP